MDMTKPSMKTYDSTEVSCMLSSDEEYKIKIHEGNE